MIVPPFPFSVKSKWRQCLTLTALGLSALISSAGETPTVSEHPAPSPTAETSSSLPKLLISDRQLDHILSVADEDPQMRKLLNFNHARAESYLDAPLLEYKPENKKMLRNGRAAIGRILAWGLEYRLNGDKKYLDRAVEEMLNAATFPDWYPRHFLGVAEMSFALSMGYNWFYDDLTEEQRATIREALIEKCLAYAPAAYGVSDTGRRGNWEAFSDKGTATNNWNQVCNGGFLAAAAALRAEQPEMFELVVNGAVKSLPLAMHNYAPDGAWPEGPVYFGYGTMYNVISLNLLEETTGSDHGLSETPGFSHAGEYFTQVFGPTGRAFNYGDSSAAFDYQMGSEPYFAWLANRFGPLYVRWAARSRLERFLIDPISGYGSRLMPGGEARFAVLHMVYFSEKPEEPNTNADRDAHIRGIADLAFMRSAWDDVDALWVGFKAGTNGFAHSHHDLGSFVLEADGVRWAQDIGGDRYRLPGYWHYKNGGKRWTYFRLGNQSHNTIAPAGVKQDADATAPITDFGSTEAFAYAIADMSEVYPAHADMMERGIAMLDRSAILIRDEWVGVHDCKEAIWRMLTAADVEIEDDGQTARLVQGGRQLVARILEPNGARFTTASAQPTTHPDEQANPGKQLLTVHVPITGENMDCVVLLEPVGRKWTPLAEDDPRLSLTLDQWEAQAAEGTH